MNVSNYTNAYENKLTVVESKLRNVASNEQLEDSEKLAETRELEQEKEQLQKKIDLNEDARKKEELDKMIKADEVMKQMSTINQTREKLDSGIKLITSQKETDISRGGDGEDKEKELEKLEEKRNLFTENILKEMSGEDKEKRIFSDDKDEDQNEYKGMYKGTSYRKKLDIKV